MVMQGRQGERREMILAYIDRASRRLTKQIPENTIQRSGDDGCEDPPVPIPNTAVKLSRVESTWLEAAREDRLLPVATKPPHITCGGFGFFNIEAKTASKTYILNIMEKIRC